MARESIEERRARLTPGAYWIRTQREQRGWTGRELARRLDIAQDRISAYERAQDEPPAEFARALAAVFGLTELEVWKGLQKPLPRGLNIEAMSGPEIVAYVQRMHPGEIEKLLSEVGRDPEVTPPPPGRKAPRRSERPKDVTHRDEPGQSASHG